jgi:predicted ATPase
MKIDRVKIKNFKSLRDIDITLSNLTLVTGVNSSGKSSFIQSLLLLKQNKENINNFALYSMFKSSKEIKKDMLVLFQSRLDLHDNQIF